ncbi:GPI-anchored surface protein, putative [Bodo saltans]|uniref:GPI-anchored surface protein, putative n=1 Tax=Bodo saltans TaxID=75058 RepID=A0A0S4J213_BODSA|nr:GPI-anchored surface protein, putative [Bodo saltans]|eukprot:CUG63233.1 GPI-anchored surface protein, putative [Bodo saltans]
MKHAARPHTPMTPQRDRTSLRDGPSVREPASPFVSKRLTTIAKFASPSWTAFAAVNVVAFVSMLLPLASMWIRNIIYPLLGIALGATKVLDDLSISSKPANSSFRQRVQWAQNVIFYLSLARTSMHVWLAWLRYQELNSLLASAVSGGDTPSMWILLDSLVLLLSNWQYHIACAAMVAVLWGSEAPTAPVRDMIASYGPAVVHMKKASSVLKCCGRILRAGVWCVALIASSGELSKVVLHIVQAVSLALEAIVQQSNQGIGAYLPQLSKTHCGALQCLYSLLNFLLVVL